MTRRAPVTLLQLAVAASVAVVPVLLGALLVVVSAREADDARPARDSERHISVRHLAALKTFEYAIVRRDGIATRPPAAETLLARFPACSADWNPSSRWLARVRATLSRDAQSGPSTATRMEIALGEIDAALLRFSAADNRRVTERVGLDGARWLDAVERALQSPVESPEYPGRRFRVLCGDIAGAVFAMARANARILDALAWRGSEVERVVERWRPEQVVAISPQQVARGNPWSGIPGCVYFGGGSTEPVYFLGGVRSQDDRLCAQPVMRSGADAATRVVRLPGEATPDLPVGDPRWKVPQSLARMLQPLEALHRPVGTLYHAYTQPQMPYARSAAAPNRVDSGGHGVDVGFSIDVTIDPDVQALAQQTAACYTGRDDVCRALGMQRKEDAARPLGNAMLEHAMVRMAAIAIVDVDTGRIEALAGALSPCTRQEYDGPGRAAQCDRRLPYPIRYRPDALANPALFHDAMPASTIKPIMAAAFLSDPEVGSRWLRVEQAEMARMPAGVPTAQSMRAQLMRSDSARFLDRMFCADKGFTACARPWAVQKEALAFGWNGDCASAQDDCGRRDLLRGGSVAAARNGDPPFALAIPYGRLLAEPLGGRLGAPFRLRAPIALDAGKVRTCAGGPDGARGSRDDWEKCGGGVVVDIVAEGWGQGHARASALGSAGMMATLAAAANGDPVVHRPHVVASVHGVAPAQGSAPDLLPPAATDPNPIARDAAQVILSGLTFGHRAGTSRLACEQVFEARACQAIDWIAGKTGTPTFPNDDRSLDELARLCAPGVAKTKAERAACGPLRPYKWYVAAYRTDRNGARWTKVIAVLTERNWIAQTGRIHGAGDHGPNPAAEIALQIAGRQAGVLPWDIH